MALVGFFDKQHGIVRQGAGLERVEVFPDFPVEGRLVVLLRASNPPPLVGDDGGNVSLASHGIVASVVTMEPARDRLSVMEIASKLVLTQVIVPVVEQSQPAGAAVSRAPHDPHRACPVSVVVDD
jgi:hypothetical protein